ncbi:MAG: hypothetical protein PHW60_12435 [Kiritimatiellae bacterium]|nr:hypothetical protein [Kiritimatiellia bacterium]
MSEENREIERLRDDLSVIKQATGTEFPFGWADVYGEVGMAFLVLLGTALTGIVRTLWLYTFWVSALIGFQLVWLLAVRVRFRRSTGNSPVRRKIMTVTLAMIPTLSFVVLVYIWYQTKYLLPLLNIPLLSGFLSAVGSMLFGMGLMLIFVSLMPPKQISGLPVAVGMLLLGICLPLWIVWRCDMPRMGLCIFGISIALMAWIEARRLQKAGIPHGIN